MLLVARPDLTWIVLGGLIVIIVLFANMIQQSVSGDVSQARRNVIQNGIGITVTGALLAFLLPDAITQLEEDDTETRILTIESGETHTVESDETETWLAVYNSGVLNINGSMDLEG